MVEGMAMVWVMVLEEEASVIMEVMEEEGQVIMEVIIPYTYTTITNTTIIIEERIIRSIIRRFTKVCQSHPFVPLSMFPGILLESV